jgi:hypothetical protein
MTGQKMKDTTERGKEVFHVFVDRRLLVCGALILGCLPFSAPAATYSGGNGTSGAPFLISTAKDLQAMGDNPADWGKQFQLTQDIDLSGFSEENLHMIGRWAALGSLQNQPFWGIFDGNGKTIANFHYRNMSEDYVGLFQHLTGEVRDLKLVGAVVAGNKLGTGALVGCLEKGAVIRCAAINVCISGDTSVGALVGEVEGGGAVHSCFSDGAVSGTRYVGGLVGLVGLGTVARSYSKARVAPKASAAWPARPAGRKASWIPATRRGTSRVPPTSRAWWGKSPPAGSGAAIPRARSRAGRRSAVWWAIRGPSPQCWDASGMSRAAGKRRASAEPAKPPRK